MKLFKGKKHMTLDFNESSPLLTRRDGAVLILSNINPGARNALTAGYYEAMTVVMRDVTS